MSPIIAFSGKKQSGKGSAFRFIAKLHAGHFPAPEEFSFAGPLKRMCVDILGLRPEQAWGTDAQKNTPVPHLPWEDFPVQAARRVVNEAGYVAAMRSGPMTGREVLQFYGTEIFRAHYHDVWADACLREARNSITHALGGACVITDARFPNEVEAVLRAGGLVVRLTRDVFEDGHVSEAALDPDRFDWGRFSYIHANAGMGVAESCIALWPYLCSQGIVPDAKFAAIRDAAHAVAAEATPDTPRRADAA